MLLLALVPLLLTAGTSAAANLMVTSGKDDGYPGTLRHVISIAANGDRIIFQSDKQKVVLTGDDLFINKSLTIEGALSGRTTIQQTSTGNRVFYLTPSITCTFKHLVITGGNLGSSTYDLGAGVRNYGTLTMENCVVNGNTGGGGVINQRNLTMTRCVVSNNTANGSIKSAGISNTDYGSNSPVLTMTECLVENNVCSGGYAGGIYNGVKGTLSMNNCKILNNAHSALGGGLYLGYSSTTSLSNGCVVTGNTPDNICAGYGVTYTTDGSCTICNASGTSATALSGFAEGASPSPRKTSGEPDVAAVERDLRSSSSELFVVVKKLLESDLGGPQNDVSAGLSGINATLYDAFAYENVPLADTSGEGKLIIEFTASWPERVRYYAAFAEYEDPAAGAQSVKGYVVPERSIQFEIKPGQPLPKGVTPPDFYEEGEGLMTWRTMIADNGPYDHNRQVGVVTFRVASIRAEARTASSGGSGCSAAAASPFALLPAIPLIFLRKR
jgi:Synergist-CTERM protein sorting domain-containing protein